MPSKDPDRRRRWQEAHPDAWRAKRRAYQRRWRKTPAGRASQRETFRRWAEKHPAQRSEAKRLWASEHPDVMRDAYRARERRRREAPFTWFRVEPWPLDCMVCGLPFEGTYPDPRSETIGHEPPIAWMLRHPEYEGHLILRPEHWACNATKRDRPDWEARSHPKPLDM